MRNKLLVIAFLIASFAIQAQNDYRVLLSSGTLQPSANVESFINESAVTQHDLFNNYYYRLIQFSNIPGAAEKERIRQSGLVLLDYIPNNAFIVAIPYSFDRALLKQLNVRSVIRLDENQKTNINLLGEAPSYSKTKKGFTDVTVQYYSNITPEIIAHAVSKYEKLSENKSVHTVSLRIHEEEVMKFAAQPWVFYLAPAGGLSAPDDMKGRSLHRSNVINSDYATGRHYDGAGVKVGIADDGDVGPHIDFTGRLTNHVGTAGFNHGDMTSGICVGAGNLDPTVRGMATGADLHVYDINGYPQIVNAKKNFDSLGIVIASTSFSQSVCNQYTAETQLADQLIHDNPNLNFVFSAGNSAVLDCNYGAGQGWGNITGGYKQGKNVITVGSVNPSDTLEASSSRGPASDGRIKPDIMANGIGQLSTDSSNGYQLVNNSGTSSACPAVAGVCAQLYQAYKNMNSGNNPDAALIKACILNSADDIGNPGPDYTNGYGRINALRAVQIIEDGRFIKDSVTQGQSKIYPIVVPAGVSELRVMVYWNDVEGTPLASKALVNNIDMYIPDPIIPINWKPWVLNPTPAVNSLSANAVRGVDTLNNVEQVTVGAPIQGTWNIHVDGTSIPSGPQTFYVVYEFRTQGITVTYPTGGEGFVPGEQQLIRWDAVKGLGAFTVDYSVNNGASWNNLSTTVNQNSFEYTWTVPDSITGSALVRVSRGASVAVSDTVFAIIRVPQNIHVDYACADSFNLKWNAVPGATGYTIYKLGNKFMDVVGTSATTNFVVSGILSTNDYWLSVGALAGNGTPGRRANAIHKLPGTFSCPLAVDATLDGIVSPAAGNLSTCQSNSATPVTVLIGNHGFTDIYNFPVSYRVNGGTIYTDTILDTVKYGQQYSHTFDTLVNYANPAVYNLVTWTGKSGDLINTNDTARITTTVIAGTIVQIPVNDDFETDVNCPTTTNCGVTVCPLLNGWTNASNVVDDSIDFRVNQGGTPTNATGPDADHTLGTPAGKYIYLETSGCFNQTAKLLSPCIDLTTSTAPRLKFWYHMFGATMGTLHVDILSGNSWSNDVMTPVSGDQGNVWHQAIVNLTPYNGTIITIRFRVLTGTAQTSDLALDDINIAEGPVAIDAAVDSIISPVAGTVLSCQSSSTETVSVVIGNHGTTDIFHFPVSYQLNNGTVFTDTIPDTVKVNEQLVHTFASTLNYSIVSVYNLSAWTGKSGDLNIANDTLKRTTTVVASTPVQLPITDNFEADALCPTTTDCGVTVCPLLGGWVNETNGSNDNIDFRVNQGGTPTMATGPDFDHTLGTPAGKYIYLESSACFLQTAKLVSPCIDLTSTIAPEMKFWYNMFGVAMGQLHVDVFSGGNWINDVMTPVIGDQTNIWKQVIIDLTPYNGNIISIRFRAITGNAATSDLALDDINIAEAPVAVDASIDSIKSPVAGNLLSCQTSSTTPVTVVIGNHGTTDIFHFPVSYSLNGGTVYTDTIPDTIKVDQRLSHTFASTVNYSAIASYNIKAWTGKTGDLNAINDTLHAITNVIAGTPATLPVKDDFEADATCPVTIDCGVTVCPLLNGWTNATNGTDDDIDFRVNTGVTATPATGPDFDHTLGTAAGKYIYLESSGCFNQNAKLLSPCIDLTTASGPELRFWYHMFGATMGTLHVDIHSGIDWINDVMTPISGDQTNIWKQAIIDLSTYNGQIIGIRFRVLTGTAQTSDLALDDINILETHVAPDPAFVADHTSGCINSTIKFTDKSSFNPNKWQWSFIPNTVVFVNSTKDTTQNPEVQFTATGHYDVKLVAYNIYGHDSVTVLSYINILTPTSPTITEDFQGAAFPPAAWRVESAGNNNTWEHILNITGRSGAQTDAARINNFTYAPVGGKDGLARLEINLAGTQHPVMTFDVAYRRRNNFTNDTLRIDVSTDCGNSYTPTSYQKLGAALATTPTPGGPPAAFTPNNANQWRNDTLDLTAYIGQDVTLKFVNISGGGNNLYLDNINISDFVGIKETSSDGTIKVYPNPSIDGLFNMIASASNNSKAVLTVTDMSGKVIQRHELESSNNKFNTRIDLSHESRGMYFVEVRTATGVSKLKLAFL